MSADWIRAAKVGDRVICEDGAPKPGHSYSVLPEEGKAYTIQSIEMFDDGDGLVPCIGLVEIRRKVSLLYGRELPWAAARFRPVHPRKTDISVFTDMLKPAGAPVEEMA